MVSQWDVLTGDCDQRFRFPSPILKVQYHPRDQWVTLTVGEVWIVSCNIQIMSVLLNYWAPSKSGMGLMQAFCLIIILKPLVLKLLGRIWAAKSTWGRAKAIMWLEWSRGCHGQKGFSHTYPASLCVCMRACVRACNPLPGCNWMFNMLWGLGSPAGLPTHPGAQHYKG